MPRAELPTQLRDDAEAARMVAAFRDLQVCRISSRSQHARGVLAHQVIRKAGDGAFPFFTAEAPSLLSRRAFGARPYGRQTSMGGLVECGVSQNDERGIARLRHGRLRRDSRR